MKLLVLTERYLPRAAAGIVRSFSECPKRYRCDLGGVWSAMAEGGLKKRIKNDSAGEWLPNAAVSEDRSHLFAGCPLE
jgi:hypothetical protein